MKRITVNQKVRELLVDLDSAIEKYLETCRRLAPESTITNTDAVDLGVTKMAQQTEIIGIAWNINKASRGLKD